jgi:hypothetical protein
MIQSKWFTEKCLSIQNLNQNQNLTLYYQNDPIKISHYIIKMIQSKSHIVQSKLSNQNLTLYYQNSWLVNLCAPCVWSKVLIKSVDQIQNWLVILFAQYVWSKVFDQILWLNSKLVNHKDYWSNLLIKAVHQSCSSKRFIKILHQNRYISS